MVVAANPLAVSRARITAWPKPTGCKGASPCNTNVALTAGLPKTAGRRLETPSIVLLGGIPACRYASPNRTGWMLGGVKFDGSGRINCGTPNTPTERDSGVNAVTVLPLSAAPLMGAALICGYAITEPQ